MSATNDGPDPEDLVSEDELLSNGSALPPEPEAAGEDEFNEDDFDDDFDDDFEDELDEDLQEFENELEGIKPPEDGHDDVDEEFEEEDF